MADSIPRASSLQAMQSLLGSYGDNDEDIDEEENIDNKNHDINNISGSDDEVEHHKRNQTASPDSVKRQTDNDSKHSTPVKVPKLEKRVTKLVSYTGHEEEDDEDEDEGGSDHEVVNLVDYTLNESHMTNSLSRSFVNVSGDDIQLPPTPPGNCSRSLQEKVSKMYEKMKHGSGLDLNASIQRKKEFRNPSIYDKLIEFCGIDEKGTNYPPDLYNPLIWGKDSYFDSLAKTQKEEMDKREKERKERTKVEFVVATKKSSSSTDLASKGKEVKKEIKQERKSKWDSSASGTAPSSSSGKSTTVISAVGTLKKPK